jgi:hypothetical protein
MVPNRYMSLLPEFDDDALNVGVDEIRTTHRSEVLCFNDCFAFVLARQRQVQEIWAEQEAKDAELHKIDYSHIPPLRVADRYERGRRKRK